MSGGLHSCSTSEPPLHTNFAFNNLCAGKILFNSYRGIRQRIQTGIPPAFWFFVKEQRQNENQMIFSLRQGWGVGIIKKGLSKSNRRNRIAVGVISSNRNEELIASIGCK